ncbi:TetR/AcrR family transcriptional regulator [Nocardia nova]|uniref:TetR/AcrR family transcriptional regulator n=1 Tax=Nocardia nova TaxID=37330 RepID=UPI0034DDB648
MRSARAPYPPRPSTNRRSLDLEQLVDVAVELFLWKGYDGTSMADIAAAVGARKSALYRHVEEKRNSVASGINVASSPSWRCSKTLRPRFSAMLIHDCGMSSVESASCSRATYPRPRY